jgi:hypothetical protein
MPVNISYEMGCIVWNFKIYVIYRNQLSIIQSDNPLANGEIIIKFRNIYKYVISGGD